MPQLQILHLQYLLNSIVKIWCSVRLLLFSVTLCKKCLYPEFYLARNYPHLPWIRRDRKYLSVFIPNSGKYWPGKLRIRTLFTQCKASSQISNFCSICSYKAEWISQFLPIKLSIMYFSDVWYHKVYRSYLG